MLVCTLFLLWMPEAGSLSCSHLAVNSSVVVLGGNITASCTIWRNHCPIAKDSKIQIIWKLSSQQLRGSQYSFSNGVEVSNITVGPFKEPVTPLSCCMQEHGIPQVMNLTQILAGYPPHQPQNLTCVFNITSKSLACQWDPGWDSLLPTRVALKGFRSSRECKALAPHRRLYSRAWPALLHFSTPGAATVSKNAFLGVCGKCPGQRDSERLCADPMDLAWLEPPTIRDIRPLSEESDCMVVKWEAGKDSKLMEQACDLRYQMEDSLEWILVHNITTSSRQIRQCGFLFGSLYYFQMRCRRRPLSYWSSWSPTKLFTTHEKAPSGALDAWWKLREAEKGAEVQLLWKPMKPQEANGRILGYWAALSTSQHTGNSLPLCNTTQRQCTFLMPPGAERIYLSAYNSRGASQPTEIFLLEKKGQPVLKVQVSPHNEKSFQLCWDPPRTPATGYIVEWHRVTSAAEESNVGWQKLQNGSIRETLIQENIEPFQRYQISVYPLYRDRVGMPQSIEAYTRQKAPARSPKVHPQNIGVSTAEVWWNPLPVEDQNGFITGYTLFWIDPNEEARSVAVNASVDMLTISGLWPSRMYSLHLMASTMGGSTNGTSLVITTKDMEYLDITIVYLLIGLLLAMIIGMVICFQKSKRMKTQFWPSVPDPANSSLGKWAPAVLQEETLQAPKACELSPVIVSAILVIETDEKKCLSCGKSEPSPATEDSAAALSDCGAHEAKGAIPTGGSGPTSYMNNPESVQYAKVLGGQLPHSARSLAHHLYTLQLQAASAPQPEPQPKVLQEPVVPQ
ncbi:LOW QUALITY PROTEIN: granulocyte colony-stimulating factor receptor [Pantherophis guttatus]|uniref:LOW QUALITY PROTEIN: granulocyte colony-stimulating factor receptor n=1 Tax=Pantherophis guttatus TaxID=94885 RepID=A0A6P9BDX8_PANGU|nr:LOW QUALITY PROTEIN: granulocyte colony-stimulating factor receptor [Pantherophis guttatus]